MDPVTLTLVGSTVLGTAGALQEGAAARTAGNIEAAQLLDQSKAEFAQGTRRAAEIKRQGDIVESNARAAMAAGGGSASDAGAIKTIGKIGATTEYNTLAALYDASVASEAKKYQAKVAKYGGKVRQRAANARALTTALRGGASVYKSYKENQD